MFSVCFQMEGQYTLRNNVHFMLGLFSPDDMFMLLFCLTRERRVPLSDLYGLEI